MDRKNISNLIGALKGCLTWSYYQLTAIESWRVRSRDSPTNVKWFILGNYCEVTCFVVFYFLLRWKETAKIVFF
jgi:hypothetical protein